MRLDSAADKGVLLAGTHLGAEKQRISERGFTLFELVVVIAIISLLAAFALDRYRQLLVDVERTSMQHDLGVMRSAIYIQVAGHIVAGNMEGLHELVDSNPMELLAEKPKNYLGVRSRLAAEQIEAGHWYYDDATNTLIYLVINEGYFETGLDPEQARFKILPVYSDKRQNGENSRYLSGLSLHSLEPYRWLKKLD